MLLSPGTDISVSIRGARFIRNSISSNAKSNRSVWRTQSGFPARGQQHPISRALVQHSCCLSGPRRRSRPSPRPLQAGGRSGHEKNLLGVGILYLGPRGKAFHIHIFPRRIGALHQMRLIGNRYPIRIIPFRHLGRRRRRHWRWPGVVRRRIGVGLSRTVRIERLLLRRILLSCLARVHWSAARARRWRLIHRITGGHQPNGQKQKR